jgi:hypothetical protein
MRKRMVTVVLGAALAAVVFPAGAMAAANDRASCVGQGASNGEPGEKDEFVRNFIGATSGREFGEFVARGAHNHEGCVLGP